MERVEKKRWRRPFELIVKEEGGNFVIELIGRKNVSEYRVVVERAEIDPKRFVEVVNSTYRQVLEKVKQRRRPAVLAKYALYVYSQLSGIPIYKAVKEVTYLRSNGQVKRLDPNGFAKATYKIAPVFEEAVKKA
jgi:hypothetical protein